jgi:hypothetical protein
MAEKSKFIPDFPLVLPMKRSLIYLLYSVASLNLNQTEQIRLGDLFQNLTWTRNLSLRQSIRALKQCKVSSVLMSIICFFTRMLVCVQTNTEHNVKCLTYYVALVTLSARSNIYTLQTWNLHTVNSVGGKKKVQNHIHAITESGKKNFFSLT